MANGMIEAIEVHVEVDSDTKVRSVNGEVHWWDVNGDTAYFRVTLTPLPNVLASGNWRQQFADACVAQAAIDAPNLVVRYVLFAGLTTIFVQ